MNKKIIVSIVAVVAVIGLMLGVYFGTRPEAQQGSKTITVTICHSDGTDYSLTWQTEAETLADALLEKELVTGSTGEYGLTIESAHGETADWNDGVFWAIYIGEESATTGASGIMLTDGGSYKLVYEEF